MRPEWFPDWNDRPCALIGAGASATRDLVALLRGRARVLVINTSVQLAPWADALYACDGRWWFHNKGMPEFKGVKVTQDGEAANHFGVYCVKVVDKGDPRFNEIISQPFGIVGGGGNGGFQGLNLLVQWRATRVLMLGIDCRGEHWHGPHPREEIMMPNGGSKRLVNPRDATKERWAKTFDAQASRLAGLGVEVINCSPISALTAYRHMPVADALKMWGVP